MQAMWHSPAVGGCLELIGKMLNIMMLSEIELKNLSRFRSELMGAAIVFIMLFHTPLESDACLFGLYRMGNVGVDIFLFLSGIGLWFSWVKTPSMGYFFRKRLLRIFPTWIIISSIYFLTHFDWDGATVTDYFKLVGDILVDWSFWRSHELTFWFVPAIVGFYVLAPFYMKLIQRHPIYRWLPALMLVLCVFLQWVQPVFNYVWGYEVAWSRMPIFFIGINCGELVRRNGRIEPAGRWLVYATFVFTLALCIYLELMDQTNFPMFIERLVYIPMSISLMLLLTDLYNRMPTWSLRTLAFIGAITLELYLVHEHFVLEWLTPMNLSYWPTAGLNIALSIPLAWMLKQVTKRIPM